MVDQAIVISVRNYLQHLSEKGFDVHFGVVFGSMATGQMHEWSDIDLIVVSDRFDGQVDRKDIDALWEVAARTDSRIEPIPCGQKQWETDDGTPILEIARQEGVAVYAA